MNRCIRDVETYEANRSNSVASAMSDWSSDNWRPSSIGSSDGCTIFYFSKKGEFGRNGWSHQMNDFLLYVVDKFKHVFVFVLEEKQARASSPSLLLS